MSAEHDNETESEIVPQVFSKLRETITITCGLCENMIKEDDTMLLCSNEKCKSWTCSDCVNIMLQLLLAQPALSYPLKCGACESSFDITQIEQIVVKQERYEQLIACMLPLFWSKDCLQTYETLAQCMHFDDILMFTS